jgi:hypothetical protein
VFTAPRHMEFDHAIEFHALDGGKRVKAVVYRIAI